MPVQASLRRSLSVGSLLWALTSLAATNTPGDSSTQNSLAAPERSPDGKAEPRSPRRNQAQAGNSLSAANETDEELWALKPVVRPEIPSSDTPCPNPIDAFITTQYRAKGLKPVGMADKRTLLRRVYLDLTGLPPSPTEQDAFLNDSSPKAYEKIVDKLLANEQFGVRYGRHWLDVLRYADNDEDMKAASGIYLWRDWVISALNQDIPYDQFVRAQLTGYRGPRNEMADTGHRVRKEPRPDDVFALGFLARCSVMRDGASADELPIAAVETVSTAFMGLTVGCAKCHDHFFDPITQRDFYAMKALFDPLMLRKVTLARAPDLFAAGKAHAEASKRRADLEAQIAVLIAPYKPKLLAEREALLPADVLAIIRKPEAERTDEEEKIAEDYFPVLRIDPQKYSANMTKEEREKYEPLYEKWKQAKAETEGGENKKHGIETFWKVEADPIKAQEKTYILTSGDPARPEKNREVQPGWPFAPEHIQFREGRVEAFSDWLTAPENPLFARVAVNRLWQWHFGEGLQKSPSDFGALGGEPCNQPLLDWLAAEFVKRGFSMKEMHKLMVTSDTYKLASEASPELAAANAKTDPNNTYLWHFRLQRLEAEPIWDSILAAADELDLSVGGPSFEMAPEKHKDAKVADTAKAPPIVEKAVHRRAAYIARGYLTSRDVMPAFLKAFDADDGRAPCPMRLQTVTAPQSLFLMNSPEIDQASKEFGERLHQASGTEPKSAVDLAYRIALARPPSPTEQQHAVDYLAHEPGGYKGLAWLLFNMDEFVYVR